MEIRAEILLIIAGAALVTVIPRVLPLMLLSRIELPEWANRWLNYVPIAVMSALIAQELLIHDGQLTGWSLSGNLELLAALPTFWIAVKTRSLLGTVIAGMISIMLLRYFF
ncbi:AzlD domain-containing protein [Paenibacillus donghaensis]|uniref:Branched-chain amino acid ABC transporter n=1 Tax=Paenibacillus donghaensis TaxID=414771 RepID=A0A2Z2KR28_9BACL|nr:AzlD domain-containing protein [Paenibacillus donghaensis]ASA21398.1 branched-chain amino acid ABC transporter [Paenibacillus donghaensis]